MKKRTFKNLVSAVALGALLTTAGAVFADHTPEHEKANWTTTLNVKLALLNKLGNDSLRIDVETDSGAVTLRGTVNKRETLELAETVAESVSGVKTVDNDLSLKANEQNPSTASVAAGEAEAEVKDAVLETKIRLALVDKMGTDGFRIGTEAASGVVTLEFGNDLSAARRQEAKRIVEGVGGVHKVVSVDKK
jgi:hyperosmotically inducible periplasmic protein